MTLSNLQSITTNLAQGFGQVMPQLTAGVAGTAAAASSGYFSAGLRVSSLGTTQPGTLVQMLSKDNATNQLLSVFNYASATSGGKNTYFGRFYRIGGVSLGATGNEFTHDAATFPVTRTVMGVSGTALNLIPIVYVTTALTGVAAQFIIKGSAGTTGYVNQAGSNVIGTQTFVFPSATTAAGSVYVPMLETGDSGIQDIVQVDVTTLATTGACDIYGFEPMMLGGNLTQGSYAAIHNAAVGAMTFTDTKPAVATSGTVTSYLGYLSLTIDVVNPYVGMDVVVSNQ